MKEYLTASGQAGAAKNLGAAIAGKLESGSTHVIVEGVGAAAVNNIVKAVAIANIMMSQDHSGSCYCVPEFTKHVGRDGEELTLIRVNVYSSSDRKERKDRKEPVKKRKGKRWETYGWE